MSRVSYNNYIYGNLAYEEEERSADYRNFDIKVEKTPGLSVRPKPISKSSLLLLCVAVFVAAITVLTQYTTGKYKQSLIVGLQSEIKQVEDEIYNTDVKIAETLDINNVKKIAMGKLGMVSTADYQVRYIDIPSSNYTVNY